jgi:nicotinic acid phosphoribosyltransferase
VKNFRFTTEQLDGLPFLDERTRSYLENYRFSGQIDATSSRGTASSAASSARRCTPTCSWT